MAQSRLEKVGTIYSRVCALIKTGVMKEETKPVWLDIYKAFPPKYEPSYDRKTPNVLLRQIFYSEDVIRAKFHKEYKQYSMVNLMDETSVSKTEHFLTIYRQLEKENVPADQLYDKAVTEFLNKFKTEKPQKETGDLSKYPGEYQVTATKYARTSKTSEQSTSTNSKSQVATESEVEDETKIKPIRLRLDKIMMEKEDNPVDKP
ncbi:probable 28S ribosomal protein S23, mitochondrial [Copidosoma floridanum]|uniref:probable 28S ribosomal protein S23, mitochondrial n=1 Tax=Copidosoma floridanum TaxID=29053 RepID=UPI0006C9B61C|nr:probable 28S ribosomal protein S23, mitochondrial [Copidosoma floridanum]